MRSTKSPFPGSVCILNVNLKDLHSNGFSNQFYIYTLSKQMYQCGTIANNYRYAGKNYFTWISGRVNF